MEYYITENERNTLVFLWVNAKRNAEISEVLEKTYTIS